MKKHKFLSFKQSLQWAKNDSKLIIIIKTLLRLMSYGWLTQSAILPKKSKQITVSDAGTIALQAAILDLKDKKSNFKKSNEKTQVKKNKGVEQRNKRDEAQSTKVKIVQKNYHKILQKKSNIYNQVKDKKTNISKILVDFQAKEQLDRSKEQQQQYEKDRQQFYNGKIKAVQEQQNAIHENIQTQKSSITKVRERLAWQRQMLNQMKGTNEEADKPKVIQSFDHILSKDEKNALNEVVDEGMEEKMRLEQIKRRKDLLEFQRIRKLKKLNIIKQKEQSLQQ